MVSSFLAQELAGLIPFEEKILFATEFAEFRKTIRKNSNTNYSELKAASVSVSVGVSGF